MSERPLAGHMPRQAGDPRVRYIGFRIDAPRPVDRKSLIEAIRDTGRRLDAPGHEAAAPWLTRYDGRHGILRCTHTGVALARRILSSLEVDGAPVPVTTLGTSGTIRALVEKHLPALTDRGENRRP